MSNAHASSSPHRIGQIAKARIEIGALLERTGAPSSVVETLAGQILDALQTLGWAPPRDLTADTPPLAGPGHDPAAREAAMAEIRAVFARPRRG